jgi:hypothetical protein
MYTWKCHKETPCRAILNKKKKSFFKNREQEGKTGPVWGLAAVGRGGYKERVWEGEYGGILYTHEQKWKTETC